MVGPVTCERVFSAPGVKAADHPHFGPDSDVIHRLPTHNTHMAQDSATQHLCY
jgi:hypothetical protein